MLQLHVNITCSFYNLPQSHYRSEIFTTNFFRRHHCLGFWDSSIKKRILCQSNSMILLIFSVNSLLDAIIVMASLSLLTKYLLHHPWVLLTNTKIRRLFVFFSTEFMASTRFVVMWPHRCPLSQTVVHFSMGSSLASQLLAYFLSLHCWSNMQIWAQLWCTLTFDQQNTLTMCSYNLKFN